MNKEVVKFKNRIIWNQDVKPGGFELQTGFVFHIEMNICVCSAEQSVWVENNRRFYSCGSSGWCRTWRWGAAVPPGWKCPTAEGSGWTASAGSQTQRVTARFWFHSQVCPSAAGPSQEVYLAGSQTSERSPSDSAGWRSADGGWNPPDHRHRIVAHRLITEQPDSS